MPGQQNIAMKHCRRNHILACIIVGPFALAIINHALGTVLGLLEILLLLLLYYIYNVAPPIIILIVTFSILSMHAFSVIVSTFREDILGEA